MWKGVKPNNPVHSPCGLNTCLRCENTIIPNFTDLGNDTNNG